MRSTFAALGLGVALAATPLLSWAGDDVDASQGNAKTYIKDSAITTKIKASLAATHIKSLATIHVDTDADGIVWLSGSARDQKDIDQAVQTARNTEHVMAVKNHIQLKPDQS